ncbi:hypothetical protein MNL01_07105 [Bartonella krasnovii]|uniref:hypothetical protein n=1 Tax=Bartonella krasnovii TaxID=2267275 RepID=UPI001F4C9D0B|nr:hypothetical protein [Bartonella krasnovii]UNF53401.1 hypothetical protein MNL01_07105 [Bartonella krasnovii]
MKNTCQWRGAGGRVPEEVCAGGYVLEACVLEGRVLEGCGVGGVCAGGARCWRGVCWRGVCWRGRGAGGGMCWRGIFLIQKCLLNSHEAFLTFFTL